MIDSVRFVNAVKKHALSRGHLACLGDIATLNVTRGCAARCIFCHARCYAGAPPPDTVLLYQSLPAQLRLELENPRRKSPLPEFVVFGTASDGFIGGDPVEQVTRACLEVLLRRKIGVSFSTRGLIPDETLHLLEHFHSLVRITIPLVSLSSDYTSVWEPNTALPHERLFLIQKLQHHGINPLVRLDPIIPFVNDGTDDLKQLFSTVRSLGIHHVTANFLHLRPGVMAQLTREAPLSARRLVLGCFPSQHTESAEEVLFDQLPTRQRLAELSRIQRIGHEQGIHVDACACQNPHVPAAPCSIVPILDPPRIQHRQPDLFSS